MDELIAFPNTKFKFGLDPLIRFGSGIGRYRVGDRFRAGLDTGGRVVFRKFCWLGCRLIF